MDGGGKGGREEFQEAEVSAVAPRPRREEPGRLGEPGAVGCSSTGAAGRTLAWENGGAVSADPRRALPGLCLRLRLYLGPRPPSRWRARPVSPPKPRANPGPAPAHLTLHQRRRRLHPARAPQLSRP